MVSSVQLWSGMNVDNPLDIATETIRHDVGMDTDDDDDDDDALSSTGSPCYDDDDGLITSGLTQDEVTAQLAAAGPVGVAAAAAIASAKKRKRPHSFETNPSIRKRQQTRLIRKIKQTIDEYTTRVGQQAVVMFVTPGKPQHSYKVFGAKPLEDVMRALRLPVMQELETALSRHAPPPVQDDPSRHELPPLVIDGIPTPVEKMTQAQLRAFIPLMLKFSTGRGKPGWGKDATRPPWWPKDVPWANVRMDARSDDQKQKVSWTHALRQIVINCYRYHGRDDLLPAFVEDDDMKASSPSLVNPGVVAPGPAVPQGRVPGSRLVLTASASQQTHLHHQQQQQSEEHQQRELDSPTQYTQTVVQTISNPDGTVSILQVDPHNPIITLPDGTQAHVHSVTTAEALESDGGQAMNIDIGSVAEATINAEGQLVLNSVNEEGFAGGSIVTIPISSSLYQTVMANVQHVQSADGQTLQVSVDAAAGTEDSQPCPLSAQPCTQQPLPLKAEPVVTECVECVTSEVASVVGDEVVHIGPDPDTHSDVDAI